MYNSKTVSELYNEIPLEIWQSILNENMDYHFLDITIENNSIFNGVKTVLDVGCGWGGTMRDLSRIYNIECTGITNTPQQKEYVGDNAILADANTLELDVHFDLIIFIQSFCHMTDDALYLRAKNTNKIFMSDFMIGGNESDWSPDWLSCTRTEKHFDDLFKNIGFKVKKKVIHPYEAWYKNGEYWLNRIKENNVTSGHQIIQLEKFCAFIMCGLFEHRKISIVDYYAERI